MTNMVFDIESAKLAEEDMPFLPSCFEQTELPPMPEFTSKFSADLEKREADINEKIRKWKQEEEQKIIQQRIDFMDKAAICPDFGRIVAIGVGFSDGNGGASFEMNFSPDVGEKEMIEIFLEQQAKVIKSGFRIAGFNCLGFDYPFIYWRAVLLGVSHQLLEDAGIKFHPKWGLQLPGNCFDLMSIAKVRPFRGERGELKYDTLDQVAKALGLPAKKGSGKDFHSYPREKQEEYLLGDLDTTMGVARKMLPFF